MRHLITIATASTIAATCAIVAACNTSIPPASPRDDRAGRRGPGPGGVV